MTEKVITVYDTKNKQIVGIIIVEEIEFGYITDKVVAYLKPPLKSAILPIIQTFTQKSINIPFLIKTVSNALKTAYSTKNISLLEPYTLESDNKNKSSRNKRMIEQLNLPYPLERGCAYYGKKNH